MPPAAPAQRTLATPLWPLCIVTFLASIGTGVLWNGIGFVAESAYGYGRLGSFALSLAYGVTYVGMAFASGRVTRAVAHRASPRTVLAFLFLGQAIVAPSVLIPNSPWSVWLVGCVVSALSAFQWPLIESYIAGGRHRSEMRRAMGRWNLVWMSAVAMALALLGTLLDGDRALWALAALFPINLGCIVTLRWFRHEPGEHLDDSHDPVPTVYEAQLASARVLLPLSYVVVAAISPALPYLLTSLGADRAWKTPLAATWLVTRVVVVAILLNTHGWHGRWGSLLVAGVLCAGGFATAALAPSPLVLGFGLAAFGLGQGAIYYMAIYYAMAVGKAEVDAAGVHEGLIGLGYAIGPTAGVVSFASTATESRGNIAFVASVLLLLALGAVPAIRPYLAWRRATS